MKWEKRFFGDLYLIPSKNGLSRPKRVRGEGYKMVNMGELFAFNRISNPPMELVPMSENEIRDFALRERDLLFARQSLVLAGTGKCSIILSVPEITAFESHLIRVRLNDEFCDPMFYYYYFSSDIGKSNIQSIAMQVAASGIRASELRYLQVPYPPLSTQLSIAGILSAYDDLIENNTQRIRILEEMAQAVYREWFVHFRYPGHESVPLVESELGMIPQGWEVVNIRDVSSYINRGVSPTYDESSPSIVINQKCIRDGQLNIELARNHSTNVLPSKMVKFGDVLINSTGVGTLGRVTQVYQTLSDTTVDSHVTIVRPSEEVSIEYFGYYLLGLQEFFDHSGAGSTNQTELGREIISNKEFLNPPIDIQKAFSEVVQPVKKSINNLQIRNKNLRQQRDLLLPRLISGELDVEKILKPRGNGE